MERSFKKEVQALKLGDGETFHGEGILAVTKALLQSGVSYVGGYQGAPVSHLLERAGRRRGHHTAISACIWRPAPTRPRPRRCSRLDQTIPCAAR